ncbi:SDR family oxidoreductase [Nocardia sp. NPDC051570]|uniref:SDR family oxidoreductase n=1 Tax=Nocardia sp. NPDC051570 TaxID=3364324 RepID=UPI00378F314A
MDLGLKGKRAIVTGSTSGLGLACATALAKEGVSVVICGRHDDRLATELRSLAEFDVTGVAVDVTQAVGRRALLDLCPDPDILVNNLSGPPPRRFFETTTEDWTIALEAQLMAPLEMIRAVVPGMCRRRFGRVVNITSAMVLTPRPHHVLSTSARAALTAAVKAISFEVAADNVTLNNLLPERVDTPRQEQLARAAMVREGISYEQARVAQVQSIAARRLGQPAEFGEVCAFLCAEHAGYISGQNIGFDGGSSPQAF